jgi:hypothetical protein
MFFSKEPNLCSIFVSESASWRTEPQTNFTMFVTNKLISTSPFRRLADILLAARTKVCKTPRGDSKKSR